MRTLAILASLSVAAQAAPAGNVRDFVNRIIDYEARSDTSLRSPIFLNFFTAHLRMLVRADTARHDVGILDYDPICQCQDNVHLRLISVVTKGSTATAILDSGVADERQRVRLRLVNEAGH